MSWTDFLLAPFRAFYSSALYVEAARRWRGKAVLYLLYLSAFVALPAILIAYDQLREFVASGGEGIIAQLPTITIQDGLLSTDAEEPLYIRSTGEEPSVIVIDTTGEITSLENEEEKLLVTANTVLYRKSGRELRTYSLSGVKDFNFGPERARRWLRNANIVGSIFCAPVILAGMFIGYGCLALFDSLFTMILAKVMRVRLGYGGIFAVTVLAMTPPTLLDIALDAAKVKFQLSWLLLFAIFLVFAVIGVRACRPDPQVDQEEVLT